MFFTRCAYACPLTVAALKRIHEAMPTAVREKAAFVLVSLLPPRALVFAEVPFHQGRQGCWIGNPDV